MSTLLEAARAVLPEIKLGTPGRDALRAAIAAADSAPAVVTAEESAPEHTYGGVPYSVCPCCGSGDVRVRHAVLGKPCADAFHSKDSGEEGAAAGPPAAPSADEVIAAAAKRIGAGLAAAVVLDAMEKARRDGIERAAKYVQERAQEHNHAEGRDMYGVLTDVAAHLLHGDDFARGDSAGEGHGGDRAVVDDRILSMLGAIERYRGRPLPIDADPVRLLACEVGRLIEDAEDAEDARDKSNEEWAEKLEYSEGRRTDLRDALGEIVRLTKEDEIEALAKDALVEDDRD